MEFNAAFFHSYLVDELLPNWLRAAVTPNGFFCPQLDRGWNPPPSPFATLVSQSRLIFNFTQGLRLTGAKEYHDAVSNGADFLLEHFRDRKSGGWFWSCDSSGAVLDEHKNTYGHAFVIFGLSHAARALGNNRYAEAAAETWEIMDKKLRDSKGGFVRRASGDFTPLPESLSQNPIMHLFEALLALGSVSGYEKFTEKAEEVGWFVLEKLLRKRDGVLPEVYDTDWKELPAERGGRIDIGHQFEWAFLLSEAVSMGLPAEWLDAGRRFLKTGIENGIDGAAGGVRSPAAPDNLDASGGRFGWWEQCEAARACFRYARGHGRPVCVRTRTGRPDLLPVAERTARFAWDYFADPEAGGWFSGGGSKAESDDRAAAKGSEWKVDYHLVGLCLEASGSTGQTR